METQATRSTIGQKAIAIAMAIVLALGLCPMVPYGTAPAYADELAAGQLAAQAALADGTYKATGLTSSLGMYHFDEDSARVVVKGSDAWLVTTVTEANIINRYEDMAYGAQSKILDAADTTNKTLVSGTKTATVTEAKDASGAVIARTFALPVEKSVLESEGNIYYMLKYRTGYEGKSTTGEAVTHDGDWYKAKGGDYYFYDYELEKESDSTVLPTSTDIAAAVHVDELIAAIQVQERTDTTDADCAAAKAAWDALTDAQKAFVVEADYFERNTGDAAADDALATAPDKTNEILVVSFGTSFNDSRVKTIGAVEKAIQAANPDWSVRRAFTAQIIINHIQARDGEKINNVEQALEAAVTAGVKNLVVQPTHLMHGAEYDELCLALEPYQSKMSITVAEPLLGEVGATTTEVNADKEAVAKAVAAAAAKDAGYDDVTKADIDGAAIVLMGHGTEHSASMSYQQMQTQMDNLGYKNVFVGTVEGLPESTSCENVIAAVQAKGYKKVFLRPLMVVAGDHANNDMADEEDEESWVSQFKAAKAADGTTAAFSSVECQIAGLGEIPAIQQLYVAHTAKVLPGNIDLTISNNSPLKMFKAVSATAKKNADGSVALTMALSGTGYEYLFKGTKDEAVAVGDDSSKWIKGYKNAYGKMEFQIPITAEEVGKYVPIVSISKSKYDDYKAGKGSLTTAFYDRMIIVDPEAATLVTDDYTDPVEMVNELIAKIQVQKRTDTTDADCAAAKAAWDALTDAQQKLVDEADYFGLDTGDASKDDPLATAPDKTNEILVVSFGTSYNDSRAKTIGAIEKTIQAENPDWSVRRAFTAQIIINHIQARDGVKINNVEQALEAAVTAGVKNLVVQPTHLMHGAEYDELCLALEPYQSKMSIKVAEPLLGEVGADKTVINEDKEAVAKAAVAAACKDAKYADAAAAAADGTAIVFMGHGTEHAASVTYEQMQTVMGKLGYENVFVGTVEGLPESTKCDNVIAAVKAKGYKKVILRPLMVVAGDHAHNDMADPEDEESWYSQFKADGSFGEPVCQIAGLGEIPAVQQIYATHVYEVVTSVIADEQKAADESAAKAVADAIAKIPADVTTEAGKKAVADARAAYDKLTDSQKALVDATTVAKLTKAEESVKKAEEAGKTPAKNSTFKVAKVKKSYKAKAGKKVVLKAKKLYKVSGNKGGKVTFKKANKVGKKKITVAKNGNITVKKGLKAGKYTVKVKATAKATAKYAKATKSVKIKIVVK